MAYHASGLMRQALARNDPNLPADAVNRIAAHMVAPGTPDAVLKLYRTTGPDAVAPYADRLAGFDRNVLIMWGTEDRYVPFAQTEQYRQIFAHCEIHAVAGAGHWPWLEQPDTVAGYLTNFLRRLPRKAT